MRRLLWPGCAILALAAASCVLAPVLMATTAGSPAQAVAALGLFALAPGAALVPVLRRAAVRLEPGLVVAVSLGVSVLVAEAMLVAGAFSPETATFALAGVCLPAILWHLVRGAAAAGRAP